MYERTNYISYQKKGIIWLSMKKIFENNVIISLFGLYLSMFQTYQININLITYFQRVTLAKNRPGNDFLKNSRDLCI